MNIDTAAFDQRMAGAEVALRHRDTWERKPRLRDIYADFYDRLARLLADVPGPNIELGSGPGTLRTRIPNLLSSDIVAVPWLDFVADACRLPLADGSVANLLMVDVLHHLSRPQRFLAEVTRLLAPGGRLVLLDVYLSPLSYPVYRFLHPEPASLSIRPLDAHPDRSLFDERDPWASDQGMARALFWKQAGTLSRLFPRLRVAHREVFSTFEWPLSGGFDHPCRIPACAAGAVRCIDRLTERLARYLGFRCLVALERVHGSA